MFGHDTIRECVTVHLFHFFFFLNSKNIKKIRNQINKIIVLSDIFPTPTIFNISLTKYTY